MKYYIHVRGSKIPVTETVYKSYWQLVNHEKYLNRKDRKLKRTAYNGQYKKVIYCSYKEVLFSWLKKEASSPNIHPSSNYR